MAKVQDLTIYVFTFYPQICCTTQFSASTISGILRWLLIFWLFCFPDSVCSGLIVKNSVFIS